jgi:hypothetical protein
MGVRLVTGDAVVEHRILWLDTGRRKKNIEHLAPLVGGNLNRN